MSDVEKTDHAPARSSDTADAIVSDLPHVVLETPKPEEKHPANTLKQLLFSETALLFTALLSFLILFWGFVVATALHHVIISNTSAAYVLWSIPQAVTSIVTPISTCFSVIIGVLYTRSLRLAARKSLTNALEIRSLVGWNALMGKRVMGMPFGTGSRWAKFALVSWFLLTTLTTGFNAFITPQKLPQVRSLETFGELDMSTDAFLYNLYTPMSGNLQCQYGNYSFFTCSTSRPRQPLLLLEAGESAALSDLGYSVTTNFAVAAFWGTSRGVMPIGAYIDSIWFADNSSNPFYDFYNTHRTAYAIQNYTITYQQQGLTANVACNYAQSSPLAYTVNPVLSNVTGLNSSLSLINPTIACDGVNATPLAQQIVGTDFVLAASCSYPNQTQYIYLQGLGAYQADPGNGSPVIANMTCTLDPLLTTNTVTYYGWFNALTVANISSKPAFPNSNTTIINDIAATLTGNILQGQSGNGNTFADFVQGLALANYALGIQPGTNLIVQSMFRGMFEVSGLAINGYWSSKLFTGATLTTLLNSPYIRQVHGSVYFSLYGWDGDSKSIMGLIPFTVLTIIAFVLLLWTRREVSHLRFDPSNPLHLMVASAGGDFGPLSDVNVETDDVAKSSTRIAYTNVNGRWALTDRPTTEG